MEEKIKILKQQINLELDSLKHDETLPSVVEIIKKHINSIQYENKSELEQKKVWAYLEHFKSYQIKELNKLIVRGNDDLFDDTDIRLGMMVEECEDDIEKVITYLENTMAPIGAEARDMYEKLKARFLDFYEDSLEYNRVCFFNDIGVKVDPHLSVFGLTSTLYRQYFNNLEVFKSMYIDKLKLFMDNDCAIKASFARAEKEFKDNEALAYITELKNNYLDNLDKCMQSYSAFNESTVISLQKEMLSRSFTLDGIVESQQKKNEYLEYLDTVTFKEYDLDKLVEISKFVNSEGLIHDEFYDVLYLLAEKSKYIKFKTNYDDGFFDKFDEITMLNLQRKYVDRLDLIPSEDKRNVLREYKEKGYRGVIDKELFDRFENESLINRPTLIVEDVKSDGGYTLTKKGVIKTLREYDKKRNGFIKKKHHFKFSLMDKPATELEKINSNLYHLSVYYGGDHYYFDAEGNFLDYLPSNLCIRRQIYDFYVTISYQDGKKSLYDLKGNLLHSFSDGSGSLAITSEDYTKYSPIYSNFQIGIDYTNEKVYMFDSVRTNIMEIDRYGHILREINPEELLKSINGSYDRHKSKFYIRDINDGVLPVYLRSKYSKDTGVFGYYDIKNMKLIEAYEDSIHKYQMYGEGVYPFRSRATYLVGYRDIDSNNVLDPIYLRGTAFAGGVANVTYNAKDFNRTDDENFFIDKHGNRIDSPLCESLLKDPKFDIYPRYKENKLGIYYDDDLIKLVSAKYDYTLDSDVKLTTYLKEKGNAKKLTQNPNKNQ